MDTSIKRLLEVAGVDITKGKAKQLVESENEDFNTFVAKAKKEMEKHIDSINDSAVAIRKSRNRQAIRWLETHAKEVSDMEELFDAGVEEESMYFIKTALKKMFTLDDDFHDEASDVGSGQGY